MNTTSNELILVTGAVGRLGAIGRTVTALLLVRGFPVRAMVHREEDRAAALRAAGAEVVVGDLLTSPHPERINPDTWTDQFYFLNQPGQANGPVL